MTENKPNVIKYTEPKARVMIGFPFGGTIFAVPPCDPVALRRLVYRNPDREQFSNCITPTNEGSGYTSGEIGGRPFCTEAFFELLIGETGLQYALDNTDPKTVQWDAVYAARILSGIDPDSDHGMLITHARPHAAVFQAIDNANAILKQAALEQKNALSPQDWLTWVKGKNFIVYPPCRRMIEHWGRVQAKIEDGHAIHSTEPDSEEVEESGANNNFKYQLPSNSVSHSTKGVRDSNPMNPAIELAIRTAATQTLQGYWSALVALADAKEPMHPLLNSEPDGETIKIKGKYPNYTMRRLRETKLVKEALERAKTN